MRRIAACVIVLTASACASSPPDPRVQLDTWLAGGPRTVGVTVDAAALDASLVSRESTVASGIATGAGKGFAAGFFGAGRGLASACSTGAGCVIGLALLPVFGVGGMVIGAVHGGATAEPIETVHAFESMPDAPKVASRLRIGEALAAALRDRIAEEVAARAGHAGVALSVAPGVDGEAMQAAGVDGALAIDLRRILIVAEPDGDDASIELVVQPYLRYVDGQAIGRFDGAPFAFRSKRAPLADRLDETALRNELDEVISRLSENIVDALLVPRTMPR
jgi:hypothetical protein